MSLGVFKNVDGGVSWSQGRGKNKQSVTVSTAEIEAWARQNAKTLPMTTEKSFARATSGIKARFISVIRSRGGRFGVPPWADYQAITNEIRRIDGTSGNPMGGVLADRRRIVCYKKNGKWTIGWPDTLAGIASKFQEGQGGVNPFENKSFRRKLHVNGVVDIPTNYVHVQRDLVNSMIPHVRENLGQWARQILMKEYAKEMAKRGAVTMKGAT